MSVHLNVRTNFLGRIRAAALAVSSPLMLFLVATLLVRVLTDDRSALDSRQSGSLNLSAGIAVLFIVVAIGMQFRCRRGVLPTVLALLWLCVWMAIAVRSHGASAETLREGVREISVIALAVIVYNSGGGVTVSIATRLVQIIGFAPAIIALGQLAIHSNEHLTHYTRSIRSYGTFAHPDSAAMFFALAVIGSLWQYLDNGRRRADALLVTLFAAALVATSSIDGIITLVVMLVSFGVLRPGSFRVKLGPCAIAGVVVLAFFLSPAGASRIFRETETNLTTAEQGEEGTSLDWRLHKWKILLPEWKSSPIVGQGLGTTTTTAFVPGNRFSGKPPHNEYIRYLVETGVVGLAILLGALYVLIHKLLRRRRIPGADAATISTVTLAIIAIVGCLTDSLADNTLLNSPTCYAAALIIAAVLSQPEETRGAAVLKPCDHLQRQPPT